MRGFAYPVRLTAEANGEVMVRFRDLPEALTSGENRPEALREAADCLEEAIANRIAERLDIPVSSDLRRGETLVPVPAPMAAKAALYLAIREAGVSNADLARRLMLDEREIRRMLDPRHPTKIGRIQEVLALLGRRLLVSLDDAA